jgi:hypothetical protein
MMQAINLAEPKGTPNRRCRDRSHEDGDLIAVDCVPRFSNHMPRRNETE